MHIGWNFSTNVDAFYNFKETPSFSFLNYLQALPLHLQKEEA